MDLYSGQQISEMDQIAINSFKIPNMVLMENAGRATCANIIKELEPAHGFAIIFIGPGNNGGDGFVIGRNLLQHGCIPIFFLLTDLEHLTPASKNNFIICQNLKLSITTLDQSKKVTKQIEKVIKCQISEGNKCFVIVDSIFGTGLSRDIEGFYAKTIDVINKRKFINSKNKPPIFACDISSGIHSVTGQALGMAIKADFTTTYSFGKPGLFQGNGKTHTGNLTICDIGIPAIISNKVKCAYRLSSKKEISRILNKISRIFNSHKGNNGHLAIIGGSLRMAGAAILAGLGSVYTGSGFTTHFIPNALNNVLKCTIPEAMTIPLGHSDYIISTDHPIIAENCGDKIMVVGPGMGLHKETCNCILNIYKNHKGKIIVDADAITVISKTSANSISNPNGDRIFTPHPGEMARLLNCSVEEIQNNRINAIKRFIEIFKNCPFNISVILKGEGTLIANNRQSHIVINTTGNPGMATGGMGDVLSGVVGSLLAQGLSSFDACVTAAYLHGYAADILLEDIGIGFTASQVARAIPKARKEIHANTTK